MLSDRKALLHAILERPHDDAPRLVFADWLEEHGNPERAEFIRVQCRLANGDPADPDFDELGQRERTLWQSHKDEWSAAFAHWSTELDFARGFPFRATLTAAHFAEVGEAMLKSSTIREVRLLDLNTSAGPLANCLALGGLEGLDLAGCGLRPEVVGILFGSRRLAGLRRLRLQVPSGWMRQVAWSPGLTGVQWLDISGGRLNERDYRDLGRSRYLTALSALTARDAGLTEADLIDLCHGSILDRVTDLDLVGNPLDSDAIRALGRMRKSAPFRSLRLSPEAGARFNPADLYYLFASGHTAGLRELELRGADLGEGGAKEVAWAGLGELRHLDLADNGIGPEGAGHLARAANRWRLTSLDLCRNGMGDAGAEFVAGTRFEQLRKLCIRGNDIGQSGVRALAAAEWVSGLRLLDLGGNQSLSDASAGVIATAVQLAGLRVLRLNRTSIRDTGAKLLAGSPNLDRLRELDLRDSGIGYMGRTALKERFGERVKV